MPRAKQIDEEAIEDKTVEHDEDNGKFFIPFSDKQAVLRYSVEDEDEEETTLIEFKSIFIPPSLRSKGLEEKIVSVAYEYAREEKLSTEPETEEDFYDKNQDYV